MVNRKPLSSDIIHTYVYGMPRGAERGGGCNCCAFQQPLAAHAILIMRNSQPCTRNDGAWPLNGRRKEWKGVCSHLNYASRCYCIQCDHWLLLPLYNTVNGLKSQLFCRQLCRLLWTNLCVVVHSFCAHIVRVPDAFHIPLIKLFTQMAVWTHGGSTDC